MGDISPASGTIAWAKHLAYGEVLDQPLTDKVVTAVFVTPGTTSLACFYVQETGGHTIPGSPVGGIKVTPPAVCPAVKAGDIVTIEGAVSVCDEVECFIEASAVSVNGATTIPPPIGMTRRFRGSDPFGLQPAIAVDPLATPAPKMGIGLPLIGSRVRTWGKITWINADRTECCISDGAPIKPGVGGSSVRGVRVIYPSGQTCPVAFEVGHFVGDGINGVLGAEAIGPSHAAVPVIRVPSGIVYVKTDGNDSDCGLSWASAKSSVQAAVDTAFAMQPKGEVWVAGGEYYVYQYPSATLTLRDGVSLYGGFAATETSRDMRDCQAHPSTLDALYIGPVVTALSVGSATTIDGFTITWGATADFIGGGIRCEDSFVRVVNNLFSGNQNSGRGGAVGCVRGAPLVTRNVFSNNTADFIYGDGGAIYCMDTAAIITDNVITNNSSTNRGGAVFCSGGSPTISYNLISQNYSISGGAIYCTGGSPTILGNTIEGNVGVWGGGIHCASTGPRVLSNVIGTNACSNGFGGGVYIAAGSPAVLNNTIRSNTSGSGGGIFIQSGSPLIANNIVAYCSSGVWCSGQGGGSPVVRNNNVVGNGTIDYSGIGNASGNMSVDPGFLADGYHISSNSPCAGTGDNSVVRAGEPDIDHEQRVRPTAGRVDIGADETGNCGWRLTVTAVPNWIPLGQSVAVEAQLTLNGGSAVAGQNVEFVVAEGSGQLSQSSGVTDAGGIARTTLTAQAPGWITVQASLLDPCGGVLEYSARANFRDPNAMLVDIFFCLDSTGSMRSGGDHSAIPSVKAFLEQMSSQFGVEFRAGLVKFNEGIVDVIPDYISDSQKLSLSRFSTTDAFIASLSAYYGPDGGDGPELQLDALHYAALDMATNALSSRKYIVLITDTTYHDNEGGSKISKAQVIQELTASGCPVFVSLWDESVRGAYSDLLVNGGEFDVPNLVGNDQPGNYRYPLEALRARILAEQ